MRHSAKNRILVVMAFTFIIVCCVVLAYTYRTDVVIQSLSLGVIASIIASVVYAMVDIFIVRSDDKFEIFSGRIDTKIDDLSDNFTALSNSIDNLVSRLNQDRALGIGRIAKRYEFDDRYWKQEIVNARTGVAPNTELLFVGRTLSNWIHETFLPDFPDTIVQVVKSGGRVRFLAVDPKGPASTVYTQTSGKDLARGSMAFEQAIRRMVLPRLTHSEAKRIEYKQVTAVHITFTMFSYDRMTWFSPYLSIADAGANIGVLLSGGSPVVPILRDDFNRLWAVGSTVQLSGAS